MLDRSVPAGVASGWSLEVDSLDASNHNFRSTGHAKGDEIVGFYTMSIGGMSVAEVSAAPSWIQQLVEWDHFSVSVMIARMLVGPRFH